MAAYVEIFDLGAKFLKFRSKHKFKAFMLRHYPKKLVTNIDTGLQEEVFDNLYMYASGVIGKNSPYEATWNPISWETRGRIYKKLGIEMSDIEDADYSGVLRTYLKFDPIGDYNLISASDIHEVYQAEVNSLRLNTVQEDIDIKIALKTQLEEETITEEEYYTALEDISQEVAEKLLTITLTTTEPLTNNNVSAATTVALQNLTIDHYYRNVLKRSGKILSQTYVPATRNTSTSNKEVIMALVYSQSQSSNTEAFEVVKETVNTHVNYSDVLTINGETGFYELSPNRATSITVTKTVNMRVVGSLPDTNSCFSEIAANINSMVKNIDQASIYDVPEDECFSDCYKAIALAGSEYGKQLNEVYGKIDDAVSVGEGFIRGGNVFKPVYYLSVDRIKNLRIDKFMAYMKTLTVGVDKEKPTFLEALIMFTIASLLLVSGQVYGLTVFALATTATFVVITLLANRMGLYALGELSSMYGAAFSMLNSMVNVLNAVKNKLYTVLATQVAGRMLIKHGGQLGIYLNTALTLATGKLEATTETLVKVANTSIHLYSNLVSSNMPTLEYTKEEQELLNEIEEANNEALAISGNPKVQAMKEEVFFKGYDYDQVDRIQDYYDSQNTVIDDLYKKYYT